MSEPNTAQPTLHSLGGHAAPPEIVEGWKAMQGLAETAIRSIWDLITPMLIEPNQAEHQQRIQQFAQAHAADPLDVLAAVSSAGLLVEGARAHNLPPETFQEDVRHLSGGKLDAAARHVGEGYPKALAQVRQHAYQKTLALHGNLLVGLDWRIDRVESSSAAGKLAESVMFMTLSYLENEQPRRLTLQVTPEVMGHLRTFVEQFSSDQGAGEAAG